MPKVITCKICGGSGRVMGGGMMQVNCHECDGKGKFQVEDNEIDYLEMKKSEGYKSAKKRLMAQDKKLSIKEAELMLDDELKKEFEC